MIDEFARRNRAPIFFAADRRVFLLGDRDRLVNFGRELGPHLLQAVTIHEFVFEHKVLSALERVLRERFAFDVLGHVARVVMLTMASKAQGRRDNELR